MSHVTTAALVALAIGASVACTAVKDRLASPDYQIVRLDAQTPRQTAYGLLHTDTIRDNRTGVEFTACQTDHGEADCATGAPPQ